MKNIVIYFLAFATLAGCASGSHQLYKRERYYTSTAKDLAQHAGITSVEDTPIIIINEGLKRSGNEEIKGAINNYDLLAPSYKSMSKSKFNKISPAPDGYLGFFPIDEFSTKEKAIAHFKAEILKSFNRVLPEYNFVELTDGVSAVSSKTTYAQFTIPALMRGEIPKSIGGGEGWLWESPYHPQVKFIGAMVKTEDLDSLRQSLLYSNSRYVYRYLGAFEKRFPQIVGNGKVHYFISEP